MAGTIVVDRIESDASYASTINVAGQITFSNTVNFGVYGGTAPVAGFYLPSTNNLAFTTASTERLRIDNAGNIGIGTSGSPSTTNGAVTLNVGLKTANNMVLSMETANLQYGGSLEFRRTSRAGNARFAQITGAEDSSANGILYFYTAAATADVSERMRLTGSGLLLLGDSSGSAKLEIANASSPYDNVALRMRAGTAGINFVQQMAVFIVNAITWTTIVRITPSNLSQTWQRGLVTASIAGHTSGVNNGALSQAVYYFDNNDATRTCGVVSAGTGSGTGAPQFRTVMDNNTYVLQVQSSNGTNRFDGVADITIICPGGAGNAQTFTISYS